MRRLRRIFAIARRRANRLESRVLWLAWLVGRPAAAPAAAARDHTPIACGRRYRSIGRRLVHAPSRIDSW
jgi:hypothetical protein